MKIAEMTREEVADTYREHMCVDFPEDELKDLEVILRSLDEGHYSCTGCYEDGNLLGYAFMSQMGRYILLDYLAVCRGYRNRGIGTAFLKILLENLKDSMVLGELEDPDSTQDREMIAKRKRRIGFYRRMGFEVLDFRAELFGVRYLIIRYGDPGDLTDADIRDIYSGFYDLFYPAQTGSAHVRLIT